MADSNNTFRSDRSDSTSSTGTTGSTGSTASRRRASQGLFEGLTAQKRKDDPVSVARRQSMSDQRPKSGFIGQMWSNWVRGTSSSNK